MILKKPIQLNMGLPPLTISSVFEEKLLSNYELMPSRITPKELLYLTTAPAELPEDLGGMTAIAVNNSQSNVHQLSLNVVNNVVNRLLLSQEQNFTYQDRVYVSTVLHKLGVTDVNQFMRQVRELYDESVSIGRLNTLYRENSSRLEKIFAQVNREERSSGKEPPPQSPALPAPRYYLHNEVYNRLQTAQLYETFCSLMQNRQLYSDSLFHNELKLSEQSRVSQELSLWNQKQTVFAGQETRLVYALPPEKETEEEEAVLPGRTETTPAVEERSVRRKDTAPGRMQERAPTAPAARVELSAAPRTYLTLHHHVNRYETGELLPPPQTEEQVLAQGAQAILLALTDQVLSTQISRLTAKHHHQQWIDIRSAVSQSVQNALTRYQEYHTEQYVRNTAEREENHWMTALYRQEETSFTQLLQQYENVPAGQPFPPIAPSRPDAEMIHRLDAPADSAEEETVRRSPSEPSPAEIRTRELVKEFNRIREKNRELVKEAREEDRQAEREPSESASPNSRQLFEEALAVPPVMPREGREGAEPPVQLTHPETGAFGESEESGPAAYGDRSPAEPETPELVRELNRVDERNREILKEVLQNTEQKEQRRARSAPPPDPKRVFRDSLLAMQNPEQFLRQMQEQPVELTHPQAENPAVETILEHAGERTREVYQALMQYERDPAAAIASGVLRPAGTGELNAAVREQPISRTEREELTHLRREQVEIQDTVREQVHSVVDRYLEPEQAAQAPVPQEGRRSSARIVHRAPEQLFSEEFLEQLEQRRTNEVRQTEETHTVTQETVNETQINNIRQQVVERTAEDIAELVNRTLARQIGTISDKVYGQMERRLQSERARRGWK